MPRASECPSIGPNGEPCLAGRVHPPTTMCGNGDTRWWMTDSRPPTSPEADAAILDFPTPEPGTPPTRVIRAPWAIGDEQQVLSDVRASLLGVEALLRLMGVDPDGPGVAETPERVVAAFTEMSDRPGDPATILARTFSDVDYPSDQMIALGPIEFTSICEHHLLPFTGTAFVAYIPTPDRVVGLSKLARLVDHFARRPQVQERLTNDIAAAIMEHLQPNGVGVVVRAAHTCMSLRGVRKTGSAMVTSVLLGDFRDDPSTRAEFLALTRA